MNITEENVSNIIGLVIALGLIVLGTIYEVGFSIFLLTIMPIFLMSRGLSTLAVDITMLILLILIIISLFIGGEITSDNMVFIFCPLTGYVLWRYLKS